MISIHLIIKSHPSSLPDLHLSFIYSSIFVLFCSLFIYLTFSHLFIHLCIIPLPHFPFIFFTSYTVLGILALVLLLRSVGLSSGATFGAVLGLTGGISGMYGIILTVMMYRHNVQLDMYKYSKLTSIISH